MPRGLRGLGASDDAGAPSADRAGAPTPFVALTVISYYPTIPCPSSSRRRTHIRCVACGTSAPAPRGVRTGSLFLVALGRDERRLRRLALLEAEVDGALLGHELLPLRRGQIDPVGVDELHRVLEPHLPG